MYGHKQARDAADYLFRSWSRVRFQLPQYVAGRPSLMGEYTKWKEGRETAQAQRKKKTHQEKVDKPGEEKQSVGEMIVTVAFTRDTRVPDSIRSTM